MRHVFVETKETNRFFPENLNKKDVMEFKEMCSSDSMSQLFQSCRDFQRNAVLKWNPKSDEVTPSTILGMNPLDEAPSMETGAIVLKLLLEAGLMKLDDDKSFVEGDLRELISKGDTPEMAPLRPDGHALLSF